LTNEEPKPVEEIIPSILEDYSDEPRGWRVMSTPVGDILVLGPTSTFQMKLIPLGPQKFTGAGVEITEPRKVLKRIRQTPEYGLRGLSSGDISDLMSALNNPESSSAKLHSILQRSPESHADLTQSNAEHILSGPVLTRPDLGSLDPTLLKMQRTLDLSAAEVFRRKYPMRSGMYF
jgi:hypothetical protein